MSRFKPGRVPPWLKLLFIVVLGLLMRAALLLYVVATIWLIATGRFEGFV